MYFLNVIDNILNISFVFFEDSQPIIRKVQVKKEFKILQQKKQPNCLNDQSNIYDSKTTEDSLYVRALNQKLTFDIFVVFV